MQFIKKWICPTCKFINLYIIKEKDKRDKSIQLPPHKAQTLKKLSNFVTKAIHATSQKQEDNLQEHFKRICLKIDDDLENKLVRHWIKTNPLGDTEIF